MKKYLIFGSLVLSLVPMIAVAAPAKTVHHASKKTAAAMYECQKCHMQVSAAEAKKDGYKDSMDGGAFVPVKTAKK